MYSNMLDLGNPGDPGPGAEARAHPELPALLWRRPDSGIWADMASVARWPRGGSNLFAEHFFSSSRTKLTHQYGFNHISPLLCIKALFTLRSFKFLLKSVLKLALRIGTLLRDPNLVGEPLTTAICGVLLAQFSLGVSPRPWILLISDPCYRKSLPSSERSRFVLSLTNKIFPF